LGDAPGATGIASVLFDFSQTAGGRGAGFDPEAVTLSHPGLSEFHLEPTTAPVSVLFLNCPSSLRPDYPT